MEKAAKKMSAAEKKFERGIKKQAHTKNLKRAIFKHHRFSRFLRVLGPGLVTGAADDDPSGIATYSQAGAGFGYGLLWAFPFMYPLLLGVQESCARIGAITGKGLAAVIKRHYSKKVLLMSVLLVVVANTLNIGADLGAMAATTRLFIDIPYTALAIFYSAIIMLLVVTVSYKTYAKVLKWLAITLFAYPITAFLVGQDWPEVIRQTFTINVQLNFTTIYIIVGMLGTTISPYLFFWDTSEVVEEERINKEVTKVGSNTGITKRFLHNLRLDNFVGMTLASITAWFIVIACASTLHQHGITQINTAADAAKALEPLVQGFPNSGLVAKLIFSVGIIGLGLLAVPVLAGSSSYAITEMLGWREGLHRNFSHALGFYVVIIIATLVGLSINFIGIDPIQALVFTAVFNGIAAVPLLYMIARVGNSKKIMGEYKNGFVSNFIVRITLVIMTIAVLVLGWAFLRGL